MAALTPSSTFPQSPAPSVPSAPHERLAFFEGTWTMVEAPPGQNFRETCAWLGEGRRHMLCRSRWTTATAPREALSVISYSHNTADYLYHGFRAGGSVVTQRGVPKDDGWLFTSEQGAGAAKTATRVTITQVADGDMQFTEESATGGGPWSVNVNVRYKRVAQ
ncbi:MAG: hypothetical protein V4792_14975 [Pseudomonadota bacterium]